MVYERKPHSFYRQSTPKRSFKQSHIKFPSNLIKQFTNIFLYQMIKMAIKPKRHAEYKEVTYNDAHWTLLAEFRKKAISLMASLENFHLPVIVHGSIARGDVKKDSDIDIFIAEPQNSFLVETALQKSNVPINARLLVQATPSYAIKAHIEVDEKTSVSFPLTPLRRVEREFYRFGGEVNIHQLKANAMFVLQA